jgi:2-keto-3-deoxy-L-rhamnonate aldolase RhmA
MEQKLTERMRADGPVTGTWVSLSDPTVAELYAELGFEFVLIDTEHTSSSLETVTESIRAVDAATTEAASVVRVPAVDATRIKRVLDLGVDGIMTPMVEGPDDAAAVVEAVRYPPDGIRGVGAGRANRYGLDLATKLETANEYLTTIVQIETRRGVEQAGAIATTEGIDSLFVGPADLSHSLGSFADWHGEEYEDAVKRVIRAGHDADKPVGTLAIGDEQLERWAAFDFDYVVVGYDVGYLIEGSRHAKETYESIFDSSE